MKVLHTSDWHLGHTLYGYDRNEEQQAMLDQMCEVVKSEQPDVMVVSGDVYDTSQPSAAVQKMFSEGMLRIHLASPEMKIVVTAGNHDSGSKHVVNQKVWHCFGVEMIGSVAHDEAKWEDYIIKVGNKGYVIAVPYVYERNLPKGFFQTLLDKVAERNAENLPVVMMAHLTVSGSNFSGHEQADERIVGGIESCQLEDLGSGYDYLALGHIHKEQFIKGSDERARYCGTPIPVSFDEIGEHSVTIVELDEHGAKPRLKMIGIENPVPLVTLPNEGYGEWKDVLAELSKVKDDDPSYIRLNVQIKDFLPVGAKEEAEMRVEGKKCKLCHINACKEQRELSASRYQSMSVDDLQKKSPIEIAERYAKDEGFEFDDEMREMFREAMEEVNQESQNQ